jgi:2-keto-4-pentenoate hydratase/2-oxohepta-3-ene-1,7-dioic acid hydratase in catechol pathway
VTAQDAELRLLPRDVSDIHALIEGAAQIGDPSVLPRVALSAVALLAPLAPRRNIMCVGKNYSEHAREFARSGFEAGATTDVDPYPALFSKLPSAVIGPGAPIPLHPEVTEKADYEAELAVVIGPGGRGIPRERAFEHVWGYTILNDVTARDLQRNHKQWFLGKSLDGFAPMGPWIVTADALSPADLRVTCRVNGALRQDANTRDLIFDIPTLIATLSAGITLAPGDVIATGTPAGVGIGMDPPRFLRPGDEIEIEIEGVGVLANRCA